MDHDPPLSREEEIALGRVCGCGNCKYCYKFQMEQVHREMEAMVRNGRAIALSAREEHIRQWRIEDEQPKR